MEVNSKNKVGRPETDDKALPVTIYTKESAIKKNGGKKKYRKALKELSKNHLEK